MIKKTFISHSSKDKKLVLQIAERLTQSNVWFDMWDLDAGDVLSDKIETGIDEAKNFLLILSKNSVESNWVKYELNMALIKFLENEDYRLIVVRTDEVDIPLRLKPFLRIDNTTSANIIDDTVSALSVNSKPLKRLFINRNNEITSLQDYFYDDEIKFISIVGFFGMGKSSLIREALKRTYSNPEYIEINLSPAHFGSRLTLELCSKAKIDIPRDKAPQSELDKLNLLAIEILVSKNHFIIFNKVETILDDLGRLNDDLAKIIQYFIDKEVISNFPLILLSTRWIDFKWLDKKTIGFLALKGLNSNHLNQIIQSEIERISPNYNFDKEQATRISNLLHGYPLAGRLASPFIVKFGFDYLIKNMRVINQLKIDIAEEIISKVNLNESEINILEILAIFEKPLDASDIINVLSINSDVFNSCIDNLVSFNLIETEGVGLFLHPLINDFYLKRARTSANFSDYANKLAEISKNHLSGLDTTNSQYVYWLTNACRLLFYCDKSEESRQLRSDLIGELKDAAIKLYQKQDYETSLKFCDDFLESRPTDKDILFTKARCLSRVGKMNESIEIIKELLSNEENKYKIAKYQYAIGRAYVENSHKDESFTNEAEKHFLESIRVNEHESALQSMGELLYRKGNNKEAAAFLKRKLETSPNDPYALSIYSDILWSMGEKADAIAQIIDALKLQPKNPNFLFRAGRFFVEENDYPQAYKYFTDAVNIDDTYLDARLSLTDCCLNLDKLDQAKSHIDYLTKKVKGEKLNILDSIRVSYFIKCKNIQEAERIASQLIKLSRNPITIGFMARIHIIKYRESVSKGLLVIGESEKIKAIDLLSEGLGQEPNNTRLQQILESIN